MKIIKALYNFIVGDMVILVGVIITFLLLALITTLNMLAALRIAEGAILIVALLIVLVISLRREIKG